MSYILCKVTLFNCIWIFMLVLHKWSMIDCWCWYFLLPDTSLRLWDTEMGMVRGPNLTTGMAVCVRLQLQNTEHESKGTTEQ